MTAFTALEEAATLLKELTRLSLMQPPPNEAAVRLVATVKAAGALTHAAFTKRTAFEEAATFVAEPPMLLLIQPPDRLAADKSPVTAKPAGALTHALFTSRTAFVEAAIVDDVPTTESLMQPPSKDVAVRDALVVYMEPVAVIDPVTVRLPFTVFDPDDKGPVTYVTGVEVYTEGAFVLTEAVKSSGFNIHNQCMADIRNTSYVIGTMEWKTTR